ncbi:MAG: LacI family DNA-binding transcriptional regulator [Chloroflexota bacterium]
MPVTIKDIAKAAGVSHTTVSRALNNNPVISVKTAERIQALAQEMGYTPSAVAQSLLSRRTQTIGVVVTTIADPFIIRVVEGIERAARQAGYSVFLTMSHNDPDQEMEVVKTLHRRRVDAIIVTSSRIGSLYRSQLDQIEIPIVLINVQEEGHYLHSVTVDDRQGAQLAIEHLINLGHRKIGYIGIPNRPRSNRRRILGYQAAFEQAGLEFNPALIIFPEVESAHEDFHQSSFLSFIKTEEDRGQSGYYLTQGATILPTLQTAGATAVFCYNDLLAIGLLAACREQGVAVPDDLSVIGFDNIEPAVYVTPPLTTVRQPRTRLGELATEMALDLLNQKEVQDQVLSGELIVRSSTAPYKLMD